ncbi:MAG TPA: hypothetical protein PLK33_07490 [bacterium]|nr:hypothetical protein [bacterium]
MSIIFMLALSILLVAVLLLSNQEIYATQVCLNGNKAFYYAEAGVEYAQAQLLNGKSVDELNQPSVDNSLKEKLDSKISSLNLQVENPSSSEYTLICKVNYNKTNRKIVKKIKLYTGIWEYAMASSGKMDLYINPGSSGKIEHNITINGDIASNSEINFGQGDTYDDPRNPEGLYIPNQYTWTPKARLTFPTNDIDYYRSIADYIYKDQNEFINALNSSNPPTGGLVFVEGDFHVSNLAGLSITGLNTVVNGKIFINNTQYMKIDGGDSLVTFVGKEIKYVNDAKMDFENCILYSLGYVDFGNMKDDVIVNNGGVYAQDGYIDITNIKANYTVTRGDWDWRNLPSFFPIYTIESWSDLGA